MNPEPKVIDRSLRTQADSMAFVRCHWEYREPSPNRPGMPDSNRRNHLPASMSARKQRIAVLPHALAGIRTWVGTSMPESL